MKKIILALLVVIMAMAPVMADENWVGVDLGVPFGFKFYDNSTFSTIGLDATVRTAFYLDRAETMGIGAALGFDFTLASKVSDLDFHSTEDGAFTLSPALSFQYRLELNRDMDLRLGAGLMYSHTFGYSEGNDLVHGKGFSGSLKLTANADFVYEIDDWGIIAGADLEMAVWNFHHASVDTPIGGGSETVTDDCFGLIITPKIGAYYAF